MSVPPLTQVGTDLYAAVDALAYDDESLGWPLALYLSANGLLLEDIAGLVRAGPDGEDGWTAFADPARCPDGFLYTLAVWAGVRFPRRMGFSDLRALIGPHAPSIWRGTKGAILSAVRRYLEPDAAIYFEERADGNAYHLRVFTYDSETLDEAAIRNELLGAVPAGLIVTYEVRPGLDYAQVAATYATYAVVNATYATYDNLLHSIPEA